MVVLVVDFLYCMSMAVFPSALAELVFYIHGYAYGL